MRTIPSIHRFLSLQTMSSGGGKGPTKEEICSDPARDSEQAFRLLVEHSPDIIMRLDRQGTILYINHVLPGFNIDDVIGKHVLEYVLPKHHDEYRQVLGKVIDGAEMGSLEVESLGDTLWLSRLVPIKNGDEVACVMVIATNITEQTRLQKELTESRERCHYLSQAANEAIFLTRDGLCIDVNETATRMFCYPLDEFTDMHVSRLVIPESREMVNAMLAQDEVGPYEVELLRKDGTTFWAEIQAKNLPYQGETIRVANIRDITTHKQAEASRRESEAKYRALFEATNTGYLILDDRGSVVDANPEYVRLTGHGSLDEIIGRSVVEWTAPHDRERNAVEVAKCMAVGFVDGLEVDYIRPDGGFTPIEINARVVEGEEGLQILSLCRDTSIRKRIAEEKHRAQRELQNIMDSIPDLFYIIDLDMKLIAWNQAMEKASGLTAAEMRGKSVLDYTHPDDHQTAIKAFEGVMKGKSGSTELRVIGQNGIFIPHFFSGTVFKDDEGRVSGVGGIAKDISEQKQVEDALRLSEEKYRGIFNESVAAIYVFDAGKNFVDSNQAGLDLLGYSRDELLGMSISDVDADTKVVEPAHGELLDGGKLVNFEHRLKHKDGSTIVVLNNSRPLFDAQGAVTGMQSTLFDITERKKAEEALRRSDQNLRNLFSTAEDLFSILDMNGTILEVNDQVLDKLGYTREELLGSNVMKVHPPDRDDEAAAMLADLIEGRADICRIPMLTKSGDEIPVETMITKGVWEDQDVLFGITRDITERKRMEEELLRTRKLESLGVLAGGIAHDFNNLLTAIIGNLSVAKMDIDSDSKLFNTLNSAEKASEQAQRLTQQLLTFSLGGTPIRKIVAIGELIRESTNFVLSGSNVKCEFEIANDLWPVEIDTGLMSQVFSNIAINADQAMPEGGILTIRAANCSKPIDTDLPLGGEHFIEIIISDEGPGISPEHLSQVFDPYFTTKEKGSGLGLATSHSIVANHGGMITVATGTDAGATFRIHLPASPEGVLMEESDDVPISSGSGRILVMDDEVIVQKVVGAMLEMIGYEAVFADEGETALEIYRQAKESEQPFVAVIMDLTIRGGMGGKEAIEHLLVLDPEVKAIVSSGYSTDPIMADYADYGFARRISKPFDMERLSQVLSGLLGSGSQ